LRALPTSRKVLAERAAKDHYGPSWTEVGTASADLTKVVWASRRGGPWVPVVNGKDVGAPVDDLDFALSADGRLLHAGRTAKTWFVWLDGQQIGGPFDEVRRLSFTSAGRPAFAARRGKAWTWFLDRSEVPGTTSELGHFNASDKRVAFGARQPDGWHMVVDGQTGPAFQALIESTFSPDGSRFAYIATRKEGMLAVVDGKEEPVRLAVGWLGWSPDSRRVAYLAVEGAKAGAVGRVVADGAPGREHPALIQNLEGDMLTARSNLSTYGFWSPPEPAPYLTGATTPRFRDDGKLVYAGRTVAPPDRYKLEGFGMQGCGVVDVLGNASAVKRQPEIWQDGIWVEGEEKPLFTASLVMRGPVVSGTGGRVGWVGYDREAGQWQAVLDGKPSAFVAEVKDRCNAAFHLTLSPDGSRVGFVHLAAGRAFTHGTSTHALRQVVATGLQDKPYDAENLTNLRFSEDGKHVAYEVHGVKGFETPGRKYGGTVVLDGVPGRVYTEVLTGSLKFIGPGTVSYVARVQEEKGAPYRYYRVTQKAP
jgi:hypothetical protein